MHEHSWACWKGNLLKIMNMNDKSSQTLYPEIFGIYILRMGVSRPSLLIESTDSMILLLIVQVNGKN